MNICICDDNLLFAQELEKMVQLSFEKINLYPKIVCCKSKEEVLRLSEMKKFDVIFLDIELDGDNGISLANEYYNLYGDTKVIFVTSYGDKYSQAIFLSSATFKPFGFVVKPAQVSVVENFCRQLAGAINTNDERHYTILTNGSKVDLNQKDIMYVESYGRKATFYLKTGEEFITYKKLCDAEMELGGHFVRCHRSYIINIAYVQFIDEKNATAKLYDGTIIIISRKKLDEIKRQYFSYKGDI